MSVSLPIRVSSTQGVPRTEAGTWVPSNVPIRRESSTLLRPEESPVTADRLIVGIDFGTTYSGWVLLPCQRMLTDSW